MSQTLRLYELAAADPDVRFSPYCWRVRMALAHKGVPVQTVAWRFTDKPAIAASGQGKVPVLVDGEQWLCDSWRIAEHLEQAYPEAPSLFGNDTGRALTRFVQQWTNDVLHPALARIVLPDIHACLASQDQDYFRSSREAAFGTSLQALAERRPQALAALPAVLKPIAGTLRAQPCLAGAAPAYADYIVFGALQWARVVSPADVLAQAPEVRAWFDRLLDAHDGLGRRARLAGAR